jgi:ABC-type transport system involved in multi-copper enzyme maturation permease subunit
MIWLAWRQFRVQAVLTGTLLVLLAAYLVVLGLQVRSAYDTDVAKCLAGNCATVRNNFLQTYGLQMSAVGIMLIVVPALIGLFWGAPLVAREFEAGTHRLVWNQSVTRTRWLAVKLALIGLAAVVVTGALSLLLTWAASRFDLVKGDRFAAAYFDSRNVVPLGYGLFAFVLGTVAGLVVRRVLVAMVITLAVFAAVQVLIPAVIRSNYLPPTTAGVKLTGESFDGGAFTISDSVKIYDYSTPGAWSLTNEAQVVDVTGKPVAGKTVSSCVSPGDNGPEVDDACLAALDLHFDYTYQPANRYWPFQWIELSLFAVLSLLVAGFGLWWIRNRPS